MSKENYFLGIDVGGTNIKSGIISGKGELIEERNIKTEKNNTNIFYENLLKLIEEWEHTYPISGIGIGFPGLIDSKSLRILQSSNLHAIENTFIKDYLPLDKYKVFIDNDANLAAYGEYSVLDEEEKKSIESLILITLGSGVGSGLIINGEIYHGAKNFIEGGHIIVNPEGVKCGCGSIGCFETEVSSHSIKRVYKELKGIEINDPIEVYEKAKEGEREAIETFKSFSYYLGIALATLNTLLNPNIIVIGGGLSHFSEFYFDDSLKILYERSFSYRYYKPKIYIGKLKNKAGIIGAANYARKKSK